MRAREIIKEDKPETLYVSRPLRNARALIEWAIQQGFVSCLPAHELHVTIAYSTEPVQWSATEPMRDTLRVDGGTRRLEKLGTGDAVVLVFASEDLHARWADLIDTLGCSWDYPSYKAHVSITYDGADIDIATMTPFEGPLIFGPEQFEPITHGSMDDVKELALSPARRPT